MYYAIAAIVAAILGFIASQILTIKTVDKPNPPQPSAKTDDYDVVKEVIDKTKDKKAKLKEMMDYIEKHK